MPSPSGRVAAVDIEADGRADTVPSQDGNEAGFVVIEAVVGLQQSSVIRDLDFPAQKVDLSDAPLQRPSNMQAADFARAAAAQVREVNAAPATPSSGWADGVAHRMESLASHLSALGSSHKLSDPAVFAERPVAEMNNRQPIEDAVGQMQRAYLFAIETSMVSRGSTESTKIFNTLLKGQ